MTYNIKKIILYSILLIIVIIVGIFLIYIEENNKNKGDIIEQINEENNNIETNNKNNIEDSIENNTENETENKIVIHIIGQVVNPGIVKIKEGARVIDVIEKAGGVLEEADLTKINLAYILEDGEKIYIPSVNDKEEEYISSNNGENKSQEKLMVNINTATQAQLEKLPGIGASIATRIINHRKENGKFQDVTEIKNVSGIGESKFNNIKNYICIK